MRRLVTASLPCLVVACSGMSGKPSDSGLTQLTDRSYSCHDFDAAALKTVQAKTPQGFFAGFSAAERQNVDQRLADMPATYRDFMYSEFRNGTFRGVVEDDNLGGAVGVTWRGGGAAGYDDPSSMQIAARAFPDGIDFALIHEMGHAVEGFVARAARAKGLDHESQKDSLFASEAAPNAGLRSYARSQPAEFWAEAYNNFYCSPDSQAFIKEQLPGTFQYLSRVLDAAPWQQGSTAGPNTGGSGTTGVGGTGTVAAAATAYVATADGADDGHTTLRVSASLTATKVYLCAEAVATTCGTSPNDSWEMTLERSTADRQILKAPYGLRVEADKVYSVTAYDAAGNVTDKASFTLKAG